MSKIEKHIRNTRKQLIYLMSPSYSGSTLLTFLLANHPDIGSIGELKASALGDIHKYTCSCGEKIIQCDFWNQISREMNTRGKKFRLDSFGTHFRAKSPILDRIFRATIRRRIFELLRSAIIKSVPNIKSLFNSILDQNRIMIDLISEKQKCNHFLDGSKDPNRLKYFYDAGFWNIKVICLYRDGRGVANSYMKHVGATMEIAAKEWLLKCKEMDNVMRYIPKQDIQIVHYEELCQNTFETLNKILEFSDIDKNNYPKDYQNIQHHILGNSMRMGSAKEIRLDEKWVKALSAEDLQIFHKIGGDMNIKLGYS